MKALVTGANGLIGSNLVRKLLEHGHRTRAFVRPTSDLRSLEGVDAELVYGDVLNADSLIQAARGCDVMFHAAAIFSYSHDQKELDAIAETGTINAVEAAHAAGVKRIVLTSSSVVFGSSRSPVVLDERRRSPESDPAPYIVSKLRQEQAGFGRAAELGVDMLAACPAISVGPHDYGLSESNAIIVSYLKDPLKSTWPGGCNIVAVEDVALGHILIAKHGQPGESYLLGSENLTWSAIHRIVSEMCGVDGPLIKANHTTCYLSATAYELMSLITGKKPRATRTQAKMVGRYYWYSHNRAATLGYHPMPARQAIARAASWLAQSEHISSSQRNAMQLSSEVYACRQAQNT